MQSPRLLPLTVGRAVSTPVATAVVTAVVSVPLLIGSGVVGAQPGETTTTLPSDGRSFGDIIPAPNSGREPTTPGDPGGWMQVMMFILICCALVLLIGAVWYTSRRARDTRRAAGLDPVDVARRQGRGVRLPRNAVTADSATTESSTTPSATTGSSTTPSSEGAGSGDSAQHPQ